MAMFIVFEGPDGSGTSSHAELIAERLDASGVDVLVTFEPSDGLTGEKARQVAKEGSLSPEDTQKLFCIDREWHVENVILPALEEGKVVICDRYIPSTIIYGVAAGVDLATLESWNADFPESDLTVVTLPSFEVCSERLKRRKGVDAFENDDFQKKVYEGYQKFVEAGGPIHVINTEKNKAEVNEQLYLYIQSMIEAQL